MYYTETVIGVFPEPAVWGLFFWRASSRPFRFCKRDAAGCGGQQGRRAGVMQGRHALCRRAANRSEEYISLPAGSCWVPADRREFVGHERPGLAAKFAGRRRSTASRRDHRECFRGCCMTLSASTVNEDEHIASHDVSHLLVWACLLPCIHKIL